MDLDSELRALRPDVGQPRAAAVDEHRRSLDAAIAAGRTVRRRPGPAGVPGRWLVAAAAVLAVALVGGGLWWTGRGGDVRLDTSPAAPPVSGPAVGGVAPAAGSGPTPTVTVPAAGADDPTPTVTFSPDAPVACGPGSPTGGSLPGPLAMLPDETEGANGSSRFDADGRLVTRREGGGFAVEAVWPAPDRELYDLGGAAADAGRADDDINYDLSPEGLTELVVPTSTGEVTALRVLASGSVAVTDECRYVQFTVFEQDTLIARFTFDVAADDGQTMAVVDRGPLVVDSRQVAVAPDKALPCSGGGAGVPPNQDLTVQGPVASTPAEALDRFLAGPDGSGYYASGYVELITPDGVYTYGAPIEPGSSQWVTLVTVTPVDGGSAATHVTASGC